MLSLIGIFLAVFLPTFWENVRTSKISEASDELQHIHLRTAAYFAATQHREGENAALRRCLPLPAGPTPQTPTADPVVVDFGAPNESGFETWRAIGFLPTQPVRYRYSLLPAISGCEIARGANDVAVRYLAEGDLDGDGILSSFERHDAVNADGELVPTDVLLVTNRVE